MSEWQPIETAPIKKQIVVASYDWDGVTTAYWPTEGAKEYELNMWDNAPTHWLSDVPPPPRLDPVEVGEEPMDIPLSKAK